MTGTASSSLDAEEARQPAAEVQPAVPQPPAPKKQPAKRQAKRQKNYYASHLKEPEQADLPDIPVQSFSDEISMLRALIRRLVGMANGVEDPKDMAGILKSISSCAANLASLIERQRSSGKTEADSADAMSTALSHVIEEFKLRSS